MREPTEEELAEIARQGDFFSVDEVDPFGALLSGGAWEVCAELIQPLLSQLPPIDNPDGTSRPTTEEDVIEFLGKLTNGT